MPAVCGQKHPLSDEVDSSTLADTDGKLLVCSFRLECVGKCRYMITGHSCPTGTWRNDDAFITSWVRWATKME